MRFFRFSDLFLAMACVAVCLLFSTTGALADGDAFDRVATKGVKVFKQVRTIVLILGGFGLIALAVLAIFGKIRWYWFGALGFGLLIVSIAGAIIEWITEGEGSASDLKNYDLDGARN